MFYIVHYRSAVAQNEEGKPVYSTIELEAGSREEARRIFLDQIQETVEIDEIEEGFISNHLTD